MKNLLDNPLYREDVSFVAELALPWNKLKNKKMLITGAGGLIGSFLADVLMRRNEKEGMNCRIYAVGRNRQSAEERFAQYRGNPLFIFVTHDITEPLKLEENFDYILHLASNTHPEAYAAQPISTIRTNVMGTDQLLRYAAAHGGGRFLFASSNEIYGENRGDVELFAEDYCGYIDCCTLRAGYPESKRCGEALCQAYRREMGMDVVIPRLTRSYGPTLLPSDTKAMSQFIRKAVSGEDIVLKSAGNQYFSYTYVVDAVAGLLTVLLKGESGEAYNIADEKSDIRLKDLASVIAEMCGRRVVYDVPGDMEKAGYSTATRARLDGSKLKGLGWEMRYDIAEGVARTLDIMRYNAAAELQYGR